MRISVSSQNLRNVIARFRPRKAAKLEFNINPQGIDIVANQDGWLTLARWCLIMAHPEMHEVNGPDDPDTLDSHWHLQDYLVDDVMLEEGRAIEAFWALTDGEPGQDVRFWRSKGVGRDFFGDRAPTGNSPLSALHASSRLHAHRWLSGMERSAVEARLGVPVGQSEYGDILYRADVPGGVIEIGYSPKGVVESFGF